MINVWGLFAAIGFLIGTIVAVRRARAVGLNPDVVWNTAGMTVVASILGSRLFEVFFYRPEYFWQYPLEAFRFWDGGLSSTGGIIGAGLFIYWFIKKNKLPLIQWLDVFAYAAPLGLMFGRIGCFLIHDHPGTLTNFIIGVQYPDGVRHDGGLEMAIADGLIFLVMLLLASKQSSLSPYGRSPEEGRWGSRQSRIPDGSFILLFLGLKGLARFILDFFRATDISLPEARYFGLTPSQYVGALTIFFVLGWYVYSHKRSTRLANG